MAERELMKLLLVDDDKFLLNVYSRFCKEAGLEVETLVSAEGDFIEKVFVIKPDLISIGVCVLHLLVELGFVPFDFYNISAVVY
jgi:two-component SAPR family response regulator